MNLEMAVINLRIAQILPLDKSSKGYIKYNKYIRTDQVAVQDVVESLELLTGTKEGERWAVVGCKTGKCRITGGHTGYQMKLLRLSKEAA